MIAPATGCSSNVVRARSPTAGASFTGAIRIVATSRSASGPPAPPAPSSTVRIVSVTASVAFVGGVKTGAEAERKALRASRVPDSVSAPVPLPATVTPPDGIAASAPASTVRVTVRVPAPASASATDKPSSGSVASSCPVKAGGSPFTGASFTGATVPVTCPMERAVPSESV
ncbi:hypothetical protein OPKNFCMD_6831 [Methylobacterium crusticola]|uniref:Translation initiation factor 2 n=1 Tax=Methylobacterium crusticola TaxID=1697972 RepID=A0ABQ4RB91_9HYPH|nr:hypothetical protein OPKNFCMD_6831 [Methylobacterium crusticola]